MENKKRLLAFLLVSLAFIAVLSFVLAENPTDNGLNGQDQNKVQNSAKNETAKNMTYGLCVSAGAKLKNECYASVKNTFIACRNISAATECNQGYRTDLTRCKTEFKSLKNECKKIKHNFLETIRYAFA